MNNTSKISKYNLILIFAIALLLLLLFFPKAASDGAFKGLITCSRIVIPSLFPVSCLVLFIFSIKPPSQNASNSKLFRLIFGVDKYSFWIFIASCIGGYPVGATLLKEGYNSGVLTEEKANNLLCCCVNAGPAFLILAIGNGIFGSSRIGRMLFFANFLASLVLLQFQRTKFNEIITSNLTNRVQQSITDMFVDSVYRATIAVIGICSYVVLFSCVSSVLQVLPDPCGYINKLLLFGEVTNGVINSGKNIYLIAFLTGFGGISVHMQVISNAAIFHPKLFRFFISRVIHGCLNISIIKIMFLITGEACQTITNNVIYSGKIFSVSISQGISLVLLSLAFLISINQKSGGGKFRNNMI